MFSRVTCFHHLFARRMTKHTCRLVASTSEIHKQEGPHQTSSSGATTYESLGNPYMQRLDPSPVTSKVKCSNWWNRSSNGKLAARIAKQKTHVFASKCWESKGCFPHCKWHCIFLLWPIKAKAKGQKLPNVCSIRGTVYSDTVDVSEILTPPGMYKSQQKQW